MSILEDLNLLLDTLLIPVETGVFSGIAPDEYVVITPLTDQLALYADNRPHVDKQEARLSLYCKGNYQKRKEQITKELLIQDFTITDRRYIGHEDDTQYHHYALDTEKTYEYEVPND